MYGAPTEELRRSPLKRCPYTVLVPKHSLSDKGKAASSRRTPKGPTQKSGLATIREMTSGL